MSSPYGDYEDIAKGGKANDITHGERYVEIQSIKPDKSWIKERRLDRLTAVAKSVIFVTKYAKYWLPKTDKRGHQLIDKLKKLGQETLDYFKERSK